MTLTSRTNWVLVRRQLHRSKKLIRNGVFHPNVSVIHWITNSPQFFPPSRLFLLRIDLLACWFLFLKWIYIQMFVSPTRLIGYCFCFTTKPFGIFWSKFRIFSGISVIFYYLASSPVQPLQLPPHPAPTADVKFRKSPTALITNPATTSPPFTTTAASTANILLSNCMNQFYPRPNLAFHTHAQQHSISKHFHHMLNQHTNFLQNNSITFDRASISGSLNLSTAGYNHGHQDVITSATAQPHHLHHS